MKRSNVRVNLVDQRGQTIYILDERHPLSMPEPSDIQKPYSHDVSNMAKCHFIVK
jgi:hypothetical protein